MDVKKLQALMEEFAKHCYSDGGKIVEETPLDKTIRGIREAFATPTPKPSKPTREEEYERIRKHNSEVGQSKKSALDPVGYAEGGQIVDPKKAKEVEDSFRKAFHFTDGGIVQNLAEGGKVLSNDEFQKHLMDLQAKGFNLDNINLEPAEVISGQGPRQAINAQPTPTQEMTQANPDEKAIENPYAAEDFVASEKALEEGHNPQRQTASEQPKDERTLEGMDINKNELPSEEPNLKEMNVTSPFSSLINSVSQQKQSLLDAQRERDMNISGQQIQKGAALFLAGRHKSSPDKILDVINDQDKYVNLPVQKYEEQIANQQHDPTSEMSKVVREYLGKKGFTVPENSSAAEILKIAPFLAKDDALKAAMERAMLAAKTRQEASEANRKSREEEGEKNRKNSLAAAALRANAIGRGQDKADERQSKRMAAQIVQRVNTDPIAKPSMLNLASLNKSKAILEGKNVPLTPQLLSDAEQDISSALTLRGMGATEGKIKRTELVTLGRLIAEAKQKWGNEPGIDLRKTDPKLVKTIQQMNQALIDDYNETIAMRKHEIASEYGEALGDDSRIAKTLQQYTKKAVGHAPGSLVMVKGKQYRVGADGDSLEEVK